MSGRRFRILGPVTPPMLDRTKIMQRLWTDLTKPTPGNLSIVGPRYIGKTVIMSALELRAEREDSPYDFVLYWHLGHVAPASNEEFVAQLCDLLRARLGTSGDNYREHREYLQDHTFDSLKEVADSLDADAKSILMLWDGFDKPLGQGNLSGNLWDQMRTLFYGKKHKIVTATRRTLRELIRSEEAVTSPFWNIFDMNPVRVPPFDEADCDVILGELPEVVFAAGAKTELLNWTSGYPPLFLALLNHIVAKNPSGSVDNDMVNRVAAEAMEGDELCGLVSDLWNDCHSQARDVYLHLVERGDLAWADVGKRERDCLVQRGFARQSGSRITASCRMLERYVLDVAPDEGSMTRLFGTRKDYEANIRGVLERRLAQISSFDESLHRLVSRAVEDIPEHPDYCLNNLTSIEDRALDLIWQREFGADKVISREMIDEWADVYPRDKAVESLQEKNVVPSDRSLQCGILQLLTGSKQRVEAKARYVSKNSYVLLNAIHSFRNRGQHSDGQSMDVGVGVAAIVLCIELLACLERELAQ